MATNNATRSKKYKFLMAIIKANGEIERRIITASTVCEANKEALKYGDTACVEAVEENDY